MRNEDIQSSFLVIGVMFMLYSFVTYGQIKVLVTRSNRYKVHVIISRCIVCEAVLQIALW